MRIVRNQKMARHPRDWEKAPPSSGPMEGPSICCQRPSLIATVLKYLRLRTEKST